MHITHPLWRAYRRNHFVLLLVSAIALFVVAPFLEPWRWAIASMGFVFSSLLIGSLAAEYRRKHQLWVGLAVGIAALATTVLAHLTHSEALDVAAIAANMMYFAVVLWFMAWIILTSKSITRNLLMGGIMLYFMIGLEWGLAMTLLEYIDPSAFHMQLAPESLPIEQMLEHFLFFSFVTLTTVGYGDIIPVSAPARFLSVLEAIFGQIYLTVLVARLVGMHLREK